MCCIDFSCFLSLGYPFALFQRYFLFQKSDYLIHIYNTIIGLSLAYFNFGKRAEKTALLVSTGKVSGRVCNAACLYGL